MSEIDPGKLAQHFDPGRSAQRIVDQLAKQQQYAFVVSMFVAVAAAFVVLVSIVVILTGNIGGYFLPIITTSVSSIMAGLFLSVSISIRRYNVTLFGLLLHQLRYRTNVEIAEKINDRNLKDRVIAFIAYNQVVPNAEKTKNFYNDALLSIFTGTRPFEQAANESLSAIAEEQLSEPTQPS